MPRLTDAERKALWQGSSLKTWRGEIHFEVLVWNHKAEPEERGLFEDRAEAEQYDSERREGGFFTSGVQIRKGSLPVSEEV